MKKTTQRVTRTAMCGVLAAEMILCNSSFVEAKKVNKQESVYVTAESDGSVNQITVSDWLQDSGAVSGTFKDVSNLTDITNIKGDETFTQSGSEVEWNISDKDIYYQGKSTEELPVGVSLTYTLDGQEVKPEDILGKSGELKIKVSYDNKAKQKKKINGKEEEIYTPFVMITGMILSSDNFSDVEIDKGRVINDGSNNIVVGVGVPGMAESLDLDEDKAKDIPNGFTVTAQVTDFEMSNTFTFASSSLLKDVDVDDIDEIDEIEDKIDDLTDAASKLNDGTEKMADNLDLFHDKMNEVKAAARKFNTQGVEKVADGVGILAKSGKKLVTGVNSYADGVIGLSKGTKAYVSGAGKIASGNSELYKAVKDLPSQMKSFDSGLNSYTDAVDKMGTKENVKKLENGAKAISDGITSVNDGLETLEKSYSYNDQISSGLEDITTQLDQLIALYTANGDATTAAYFTKVKEGIVKANGSLEQVTEQQKAGVETLIDNTSSKSELKKDADSLASGVTTVMDGLSTLSGKSSELTKGSSKLKDGMTKLASSAKQLKEGGDTLTKNNKKLSSGAKKLTKASKTMKKSAKKLNQGMQTLNKGAKSLEAATLKFIKGIDALDNAAGKLADGADKLDSGMTNFQIKII